MKSIARVVVTGIGVVAPGGIGCKNFMSRITSGDAATRPITNFDASGFRSRIAAECDFDPNEYSALSGGIKHLGRAGQFARVAAAEAAESAGFDLWHNPSRVGVSLGTAVGSVEALDLAYQRMSAEGRDQSLGPIGVDSTLLDMQSPSSLAREIAWQIGAEGPVTTVSAGCTSGLDSVGHALALIREGSADVMLAGATDAPITPITVACFDAIKATSSSNDDAAHASRPFDRRRNGFVLGEGSAMLMLESAEHARKRGAIAIAEISGFAARCNAFHMTGLRPDGRELATAISAALADSSMTPDELDYINAHGSGTKQNDRHETAAYKQALGPAAYTTPVSSIKSMVGHSLGAIGSIELAACALMLRDNVIAPTANLTERDPECDLDYVPVTAREANLDAALCVGSGFGGFQSAVVVTKPGFKS